MNQTPESLAGPVPREFVLELLEQWRAHTLAEGEALQNRNWPAVRASQQAKEHLQATLAAELAGVTLSSDAKLLPLVDELLALETRNRDWLAERKAALSARRLELVDSARNLQRLRHSYAHSERASWESYG